MSDRLQRDIPESQRCDNCGNPTHLTRRTVYNMAAHTKSWDRHVTRTAESLERAGEIGRTERFLIGEQVRSADQFCSNCGALDGERVTDGQDARDDWWRCPEPDCDGRTVTDVHGDGPDRHCMECDWSVTVPRKGDLEMGPTEKRFWDRVDVGKDAECWEWQGEVGRDGYGRFKYGRGRKKAHRMAMRFTEGYLGHRRVLHTCDNPLCVNLAHLYLSEPLDK